METEEQTRRREERERRVEEEKQRERVEKLLGEESLLRESGREEILAGAFGDGSSVICKHCGLVFFVSNVSSLFSKLKKK